MLGYVGYAEIARREMNAQRNYSIQRVCSHPTKRQCCYRPIRNMLRKEWVTIEKNCWFDREGHTFLYIKQTVTNVRLVPQRIESWPLSSFRLNQWRVEYPTPRKKKNVYYSRKEDAISYWGGMTPSEKEELLRTVSCQWKEYSQGQECSHFKLTSGNRWKILSYHSKQMQSANTQTRDINIQVPP